MAAVQATYELCVDLNRDLDFSDANEDISAYWKSANIKIGAVNPFDVISRTNTLRVVLDNQTDIFSPENASALAGFEKGALIRLRAIYPADQSGTHSAVTLGQTGIGDGRTAALYDGSTSYTDVYTTSLRDRFSASSGSLSLWIKASAAGVWTDATARRFFRLSVDTNNIIDIYRTSVNDRIIYQYKAGGTTVSVTDDSVKNTDWYHLVITWDTSADEMKAYLNGTQTGGTQSGLGTWAGLLDSNRSVIGAANDTPVQVWDGYAAHCAIWSKALTATQITRLYETTDKQANAIINTARDNLIGYWPLSENNTTIADDESTNRPLFRGWLHRISPKPGANMTRECLIEADGYFERLMDRPVSVAVQEQKTIDEIITAILQSEPTYPPGFTGWLLGVPPYSNLGETTYLGTGPSDYSQMETGVHTFNYVGDNWQDGKSIYAAFRDLIDAEDGFLFEDRRGYLILYNRHYWQLDQTTPLDGTISETDIWFDRVDYRYGEGLVNHFTVGYRPRTAGTATEILGRHSNVITVQTGESKEVKINYSDNDSGAQIGGKDVVFAATTDYTANKLPTLDGKDITGFVNAEIVETGRGAKITFTNSWTKGPAYITGGSSDTTAITVRGKKITDFEAAEYVATDDDSIGEYELHPDKRIITLLDDPAYAESLAEWTVLQRKDPTGDIASLEIVLNKSAAKMRFGLGVTLGDRIKVSESQTGVDEEYFIVGENHFVGNEFEHSVRYTLRPVSFVSIWILGEVGYSELGETTILGI
jgi:hypothetical protein